MGYSRHELSPLNMLTPLKKFDVILRFYLPTTTFFCPLVGLFGEVRLYLPVTLGLLFCDN